MRENDKLFELLAKELNSDLTSEEKSLLYNSLNQNQIFHFKVQAIREFWHRFLPKLHPHSIIERTEKKLDFTYRHKTSQNNQFIYKIAAGVLLLISLTLSGMLLFNRQSSSSLTEYQCNTNEVLQFELSDGTKVWLNSGSYLLTMEPFTGDTRNVKLFGEAYFEVSHNAKQPFLVETPNLKTRVLGTAFSVSSWPNSKIQEIELYEGKVKLEPAQTVANGAFLEPGQRARFNTENGDVLVSQHNADSRAAWRNGIVSFYNDELFNIALELERKFETRILISDNEAGKLRFTAEFTDEPLEKILLLLSEAKTFSYNISEQGVLIRSVKN